MQKKLPVNRITKDFFEYLKKLGVSKKTHKNYRSDISHFSGWLLFRLRHWGVVAEELTDAIPFLDTKLASEYKTFLSGNNVAKKTVNRRLSTLRHLARFLTASQILDFDFMDGIANISTKKTPSTYPFIIQFEKHLEAEKVSKNTIKNYLSDIKQFISWLEEKNQSLIT